MTNTNNGTNAKNELKNIINELFTSEVEKKIGVIENSLTPIIEKVAKFESIRTQIEESKKAIIEKISELLGDEGEINRIIIDSVNKEFSDYIEVDKKNTLRVVEAIKLDGSKWLNKQ
jgi:hypothetical protein